MIKCVFSWNRQFYCEKRIVFNTKHDSLNLLSRKFKSYSSYHYCIKPDSLNLVWITDDEQRLEEDEEDDSEGPQPTPYNPLIFWPAALCDMTATSIQYIALTLTYASSFQMLRGKTFLYSCIRFLKSSLLTANSRAVLIWAFFLFFLWSFGLRHFVTWLPPRFSQ